VQQTLQAYVYASEDPVNGIDPSGLWCWGLCSFTDAAHDIAHAAHEVAHAVDDFIRHTIRERNGLLFFTIQVAGIVALGVVTDGLGDAVVFGLGEGADAADAGAAAEGDTGLFGRFIERLRSLEYDDRGSAGYGKSKVPSWVFNEGWRAEADETPVAAATRIMNERYGIGAWDKGPASEYNQIVKWISRTR
jgi:hypothetical protein